MSGRGSGHVLVRLVCTDIYLDPRTGAKNARHQSVKLAQLPVFVEENRDGDAFPGSLYAPESEADLRMQAQRCWKCGRTLPDAVRSSDGCGEWYRIIWRWSQTDPERHVFVLDISDPTYPW